MRPTFATVHLDAIVSNFRLADRLSATSKNIAVIKANAYGHGIVEVAKALEPELPAFAVAFMDEAVQLRDAGISKPILVLQGVSHASDIVEAAANNYWLRLHNQRQLDWVLSSNITTPVVVWVNVDTGMTGRQVSMIRSCASQYNLDLSIANSAGILCWPESHANWNRPGYMLYGNSPIEPAGEDSFGLRPAMTMQSELVAIRDITSGDGVGYGHNWVAKKQSRIGTIAIGYGDGYPRHAPSGTPVLVNGQRVPLAGRVSMDAITVDLTGLEKAEVGDPVELWGRELSVNEVASAAGTIGYEILAGLTGRVRISYMNKTIT